MDGHETKNGIRRIVPRPRMKLLMPTRMDGRDITLLAGSSSGTRNIVMPTRLGHREMGERRQEYCSRDRLQNHMLHLLRKRLSPRNALRLTWHRSKALGAAVWYGFPARKLTVIGITGTDGKTTTVGMVTHVLRSTGIK